VDFSTISRVFCGKAKLRAFSFVILHGLLRAKNIVLLAIASCGAPVVSPPVVVRPHVFAGNATLGTSQADVSADVRALEQSAVPGFAVDFVRSICDEVGPRTAGGPNDTLAQEWAEHTMTSLGLANVKREPVRVPRWERGVESASIVVPPLALAITQLGGSVATPANGLEAEIVRVEDIEQLQALELSEVRGKIVYLATKMERSDSFDEDGRAVASRVVGAIEASKKGAIAVIVRSIGTDDNRLPHTGFVRMPEPADGVPAIPAGAISAPDAEMLDRIYDIRKNVRIKLKLLGHRIADGMSANVVGEIVGRERPQEIVLLGAHLDSWDLGRGALDDGAGIGIVLGAARTIAEHHAPKRTVRVVLFAAEEMSGAGAKQYAADHQKELEKHIVALEADAGDGEPTSVRWLGSIEGAELAAHLKKNAMHFGVPMLDESAEGGSDTGPLRAAGVPIVDINQNVSTYFDIHHTANDTFDKVDEQTLTMAARLYSIVAFTLAESGSDLGRVPLGKRARGALPPRPHP